VKTPIFGMTPHGCFLKPCPEQGGYFKNGGEAAGES
jgi:hypothetical protein